jgi:hypothetical protein
MGIGVFCNRWNCNSMQIRTQRRPNSQMEQPVGSQRHILGYQKNEHTNIVEQAKMRDQQEIFYITGLVEVEFGRRTYFQCSCKESKGMQGSGTLMEEFDASYSEDHVELEEITLLCSIEWLLWHTTISSIAVYVS